MRYVFNDGPLEMPPSPIQIDFECNYAAKQRMVIDKMYLGLPKNNLLINYLLKILYS